MEFSGQRTTEQGIGERKIIKNKEITKKACSKQFIVKSNQHILTKIITIIITMVMWLYSIVIFYFFVSAIFNHNDSFIGIVKTSLKVSNEGIRLFLFVSFLVFSLGGIFLILWRTYNKKRFGKLNRRKIPKETSRDEMLALGLISEDVYERLQNEKVSIFQENPVRDIKKVVK